MQKIILKKLQMKSCFATLDPMEILQRIELSLNVEIIPGISF
jgi:hypothetical protein